jgi:diaminopimelate decarboxylase
MSGGNLVLVREYPDVALDQRTLAKTTTGTHGGKFDIERAGALFERIADDDFLRVRGFHIHLGSPIFDIHLGSPIFDPQGYALALDRLMAVVAGLEAAGRSITTINVGGGFAAEYTTHSPPSWDDFAAAVVHRVKDYQAPTGARRAWSTNTSGPRRSQVKTGG